MKATAEGGVGVGVGAPAGPEIHEMGDTGTRRKGATGRIPVPGRAGTSSAIPAQGVSCNRPLRRVPTNALGEWDLHWENGRRESRNQERFGAARHLTLLSEVLSEECGCLLLLAMSCCLSDGVLLQEWR